MNHITSNRLGTKLGRSMIDVGFHVSKCLHKRLTGSFSRSLSDDDRFRLALLQVALDSKVGPFRRMDI
jgi:hypothetical protein